MSMANYRCRGPIYKSQMEAAEAGDRIDRTTLTERPWTFTCYSGHWHVDIQTSVTTPGADS